MKRKRSLSVDKVNLEGTLPTLAEAFYQTVKKADLTAVPSSVGVVWECGALGEALVGAHGNVDVGPLVGVGGDAPRVAERGAAGRGARGGGGLINMIFVLAVTWYTAGD